MGEIEIVLTVVNLGAGYGSQSPTKRCLIKVELMVETSVRGFGFPLWKHGTGCGVYQIMEIGG